MINYKNKAVAALAMGMFVLALSGCQKEGPAEKAGKEVDKAISSAGSEIQAAGDKIQKAMQ